MDVGVPVQNKSSGIIVDYDFKVPYYAESDNCKLPLKATIDSAGYDLYAAEDVDILPRSNAVVSVDLRIAIPFGFFGKTFSRSGLFLKHKITAEAGAIDSGYRGVVHVLLFNHSDEKFSVRLGRGITQMVFFEKFDAKFELVENANQLPKSERDENGFGSTGNF